MAQARSLWLRHGLEPLAAVFVASVATKAGLLLLEDMPKLPSQHALRRGTSPESISGVMNRLLFWWLTVLLRRGYRSLLSVPDLLRIPGKFDTQTLLDKIEQHWQTTNRDGNYALCPRHFAPELARRCTPSHHGSRCQRSPFRNLSSSAVSSSTSRFLECWQTWILISQGASSALLF